MTETSREQVAKASHQTPLRQKFWKFCLSVFHNWKFHPRVSREGSCENFYITSLLELPLVNKLPNRAQELLKPRILENFLSLFRDWDIDPPVSRKNLLCKLATRGMRLDWPATKSPEQGNIVFEIFAKTKDFPKTIKRLKNLFVFDQ